jgi:hypothetical protein
VSKKNVKRETTSLNIIIGSLRGGEAPLLKSVPPPLKREK